MRLLFLLPILLGLAGCAAPNYRTVASQYESVGKLIESEFSGAQFFSITHGDINPFHARRIARPRETLDAYCTFVDKGDFRQLENEYVLSGNDAVNHYFGVFGCYDRNDIPNWLAKVTIKRGQYQERYLVVEEQPILTYMVEKALHRGLMVEQRQQARHARDTFAARAREEKTVGLQVCTADNLFGFVQQVGGDNVQVETVGRAQMAHFGFFYEIDHKFISHKIRDTRWYPSDMWARCSFR